MATKVAIVEEDSEDDGEAADRVAGINMGNEPHLDVSL